MPVPSHPHGAERGCAGPSVNQINVRCPTSGTKWPKALAKGSGSCYPPRPPGGSVMALLSPSPVPVGWCPPGYQEQGAAGRCRHSTEVWGCTVGSSPATDTLIPALRLLVEHGRFAQAAGCHPSGSAGPQGGQSGVKPCQHSDSGGPVGHQGLQHLLSLPRHRDGISAVPRPAPLQPGRALLRPVHWGKARP